MTRIATSLLAVTLVGLAATTSAQAAKKCNIVGTWTDSYGTTAKMKSNKKGTATNSLLCSSAYAVGVTKLTKTEFDANGTPPNGSGCPAVSVSLAFQGGCTSATGTITITGLGQLPETWTKSGKAAHGAPVIASPLIDKLK